MTERLSADELKKMVSLRDVAAGVVKLEKRDNEYWACCPFHSEKTPSFAIKIKDGGEVFFCLAGETRVMTWNGTKTASELAGTVATVLNRSGEWTDAPFYNFGKQQLYTITLSRNGVIRQERATAEHRWFVRNGARRRGQKEVSTLDLKAEQRLVSVLPRCRISYTRPSPVGIAAGFVFGDGHVRKNGSVAQFFGEKDAALIPYFSMCHFATYGDAKQAFDLPLFFKDRPSPDECVTYLYGWLAGYFAADGCVSDDGTVDLCSSSKDTLEFVRMVAMRLGISTYGIRETKRVGFDGVESPLYYVCFVNSTLRENFFLIPEHRRRYTENKKSYERTGWVVKTVEISTIEDVFCAIVEDGHAFVLEDNLLTGNCQGCGKGGSVVDFIMLHEGLDQKGAFKRLYELAGDTEWKEAAKKVQESFQAVGEPDKIVFQLSAYEAKEKALLSNPAALQFLNETRGITTETAKAVHFGYAQSATGHIKPEDEDARDKGWICMPRVIGNTVIAVKMRSIFKKVFVQIAHMNPKALFNTDTINALEPVFVTEGEFDSAVMEQAGFRAVSIPNASTKITPEWKEQLMRAPVRYLAGDNDGKVGSEAMRNLHRELGSNTFLILWPDAKDANQFFKENCKGNIELFRSEVEKLMAVGRSTPIEGFTSLLQRLRTTMGSDGANDPYRLHFKIKELDEMAYVPSGTVCVIYSTYSGTGKSVLVNQIMLDEGKRGEVVVVYSPELAGANYLALVASQVLDSKLINRSLIVSQQDYRETADALDQPTERGGDFQFYVGHSLPDGDPLDFIENTVKVTGATRFVIDTLHRVVVTNGRQSTSDAEALMMKRLEKIAKQYGCIFILVGQSNKEAEDLKEKRRDAKGVLRGSREIFDVAHAVFLIHRKKKSDESTDKRDLLEAETEVTMEKNRTAGPGQQLVKLRYVYEHSRFYLQDRADSGKMEQSAPPDSQDTDGELPY